MGDVKNEHFDFENWIKERESEMFQMNHFKEMGKEQDFFYQALSFMGEASWKLSIASTVMREEDAIPIDLKKELKKIQTQLSDFQEKLRNAQSSD